MQSHFHIMFFVLNVFLLVAMVTEAQGKHHCCVSKRFYGTLQVTRGQVPAGKTDAYTSANNMFLEFDADMQIEMYKGFYYEDDNGTKVNYTIWNDHANGRSFKKYNNMKCQVEKLMDDQAPYCVPAELKYEGSAYLGSGSETVHLNSWTGTLEDGLRYSMQTSVADCTPLYTTKFGVEKNGDIVIEETSYVNMKQYEHSDTHVFDIPMDCLNLIKNQ